MTDTINHPPYYWGDGTYEAIRVIEAWSLGFCLGNVLKHICRAGRKGDTLTDLRKVRWYLDREIQRLEAEIVTVTSTAVIKGSAQ